MQRLLFVALVTVVPVARAQGTFEGIVTYENTSPAGAKSSFDYIAKGSKVRIQTHDSTSGMGGMIMDQANNTMTVIIPRQKMYATSTMSQTDLSHHMDSTMRNSKVVKVGSEVIAGIPCDDYASTNAAGEKEGTACVAHGMGNWMMFGMNRGAMAQMSQAPGWSQLMSGGFFPLKFAGKDGETMVATKVQKTTVDASLLSPPADYKQFQMPAGMPMPGAKP